MTILSSSFNCLFESLPTTRRLAAHTDWLPGTKARYESRGTPWITADLVRRSHLLERG